MLEELRAAVKSRGTEARVGKGLRRQAAAPPESAQPAFRETTIKVVHDASTCGKNARTSSIVQVVPCVGIHPLQVLPLEAIHHLHVLRKRRISECMGGPAESEIRLLPEIRCHLATVCRRDA